MERWSSALVDHDRGRTARVDFRQIHGVRPWASADPSSSARIWWNDAGVHQNITFPVHPDPVSGMHCWHQKVRVRPALPGDRYADIHVDFATRPRGVPEMARDHAAGERRAAPADLAVSPAQAAHRRLCPATGRTDDRGARSRGRSTERTRLPSSRRLGSSARLGGAGEPRQCTSLPPEMLIAWPVTNAASSPARNAITAATSYGEHGRPFGTSAM